MNKSSKGPLILSVVAVIIGIAGLVFALMAQNSQNKPTVSKSEVFLSVVHDKAPETIVADDELLIFIAKNTCERLESGENGMDILMSASNAGLDANTAGVVAGAGVKTYCPDMMDELMDMSTY